MSLQFTIVVLRVTIYIIMVMFTRVNSVITMVDSITNVRQKKKKLNFMRITLK